MGWALAPERTGAFAKASAESAALLLPSNAYSRDFSPNRVLSWEKPLDRKMVLEGGENRLRLTFLHC